MKKIVLITISVVATLLILSFSLFYSSKVSQINQCKISCDQKYNCSTEMVGCPTYICKESCNSVQLELPNTNDTFSISLTPLNQFIFELFGYLVFLISN